MKTKYLSYLLYIAICLQGEAAAEGGGKVVVLHSQTTTVPTCPAGSSKLWDGYSLVFAQYENKVHPHDLGGMGSCLPKFSTALSYSCSNTTCNYAKGNDRTFWLTTNADIPMMPLEGKKLIEQHISRCSVCESPFSLVTTLHSQSSQIPPCPSGWSSLWFGHSYSGSDHLRGKGVGQSLGSTGSCLEDFGMNPFIECNGPRGSCHYYANTVATWLATIEEDDYFKAPEEQHLKDNPRTRLSRCQVCVK